MNPWRLANIACGCAIGTLLYLGCEGCASARIALLEQRVEGVHGPLPERSCIYAVEYDAEDNTVAVAWTRWPCDRPDSVIYTLYQLDSDRIPCRLWVIAGERPDVSAGVCTARPLQTKGG